MAYIAENHSSSSRFGAFLSKTVETIASAYKRRVTYYTTVSELRGLSDRELSDIGIGRHEIDMIARSAATEV